MNREFAVRALVCGMTLVALTSWAGAQQTPPAAITETDIQAPAPISVPPPAPPRPADASPRPPSISCTGGQLTITAENSTIASVLTAVQNCIGVKFDIPAGAHDERTFLHLGPGATRTVLLALLESTDYDYVLQPSASEPANIQAVLLMPRTSTTDKEDPQAGEPALTPARRAWLMARRNGRPPAPEDADAQQSPDDSSAALEPAPATEPTPAPAADISPTPTASGDTAQNAPAPADAAAPASVAANAPAASQANDTGSNDQFQNQVTNMQQLFQQRQQMVQNENKPAPQPAALASTPQ